MHPDRLWLSLGPQLTATILELKSPPRTANPGQAILAGLSDRQFGCR